MYVCMYVCMCVCVSVCLCVRVCICMHGRIGLSGLRGCGHLGIWGLEVQCLGAVGLEFEFVSSFCYTP